MDIRKTPLQHDNFYHIFNRGINGTNVFFEEKNYGYFLQKYLKYVSPFVETYAYCLLKNHFHLLIRIKSESEIKQLDKFNLDKLPLWHVSNGFSSFIQSYTRAINKMYERTGSLFETPYKRIEVEQENYISRLIAYIHCNPQKHKLVDDFRIYPHSSYHSHLLSKPTKLKRKEVVKWFGGKNEYENFHLQESDFLKESSKLTLE